MSQNAHISSDIKTTARHCTLTFGVGTKQAYVRTVGYKVLLGCLFVAQS